MKKLLLLSAAALLMLACTPENRFRVVAGRGTAHVGSMTTPWGSSPSLDVELGDEDGNPGILVAGPAGPEISQVVRSLAEWFGGEITVAPVVEAGQPELSEPESESPE
jgi:hypothetical protein|tara:strand:+ start:4720 stop:5043 length:324 start_codon:yes stop_codon:yes gene_type:complete